VGLLSEHGIIWIKLKELDNMATSLLYLYTESPLHAGTGSTVSVIDLPIQRERITNYPHIYGSGIKGALRSQANAPENEKSVVFGPDTKNGEAHAGAVSIGEAKLVLFPVRSLTGIFAQVTCPFILARFARDLAYAGLDKLPKVTGAMQEDSCLVSPEAAKNGGVAVSGSVVLEEYAFTPTNDANVTALAQWLIEYALPKGAEYAYWRETLARRLVIIPDDAFRDFVSYSTSISTHIKIDNTTKTVEDGALWTQETLPSDTLLVTTVLAHQVRATKAVTQKILHKDEVSADEVQSWLENTLPSGKRVQIGGDETTGHGLVALNWQSPKAGAKS
jgi:CRISPR-associated protein Cmr4